MYRFLGISGDFPFSICGFDSRPFILHVHRGHTDNTRDEAGKSTLGS